MLKNLKLLFLPLLLCSCENDLKDYFGREGMLTPRPAFMGKMPQGDDSYSKGVRDGCNTAIGLVGSGMMNSTYSQTYYDFDKEVNDAEYFKGKTLGSNYCTYYLDYEPI